MRGVVVLHLSDVRLVSELGPFKLLLVFMSGQITRASDPSALRQFAGLPQRLQEASAVFPLWCHPCLTWCDGV